MGGGSNLVRRRRARKKLKTDYFDSLPDDILIQILIRIPAQQIMASAMLVCRNWHQIIHTPNFVFAHLHHSTSGLLIRNLLDHGITFLSMSTTQANQIYTSNFWYKFEHTCWSSCNGLVLEVDSNDKYELIITNPVTKQHFTLPPFVVRNKDPIYSSAIAYAATRMEHKVVRTYVTGFPKYQSRICCAILTFGVDNSWRLVDTKHLSIADSMQLDMCPLVTEGFLHWAEDWRSNIALKLDRIITNKTHANYVLTLNMETEIITRIPVPRCNGGHYYYKYLPGGRNLSLLIGRGYLKWEFWEMKPETGEWTKLPDIDLEAHRGLLNWKCDREDILVRPDDDGSWDCKLGPAGWLKYPEVIVFVVYVPISSAHFWQAHLRVAYNVLTQNISLFRSDYRHFHPYLDHRDSLIGIC